MKALPFPCIRPAQDRVLEALPAMGSILSGNDALRGAIADGLMLKDPGAAYYVYECSGEPGRVTGVVAILPTSVLAGGKGDASADVAAAARAIAELKLSRAPCRSPTRRRPSWTSSWALPKRAPRSTPSPTPRALRTACGRSSARTLLPPSVPCSTKYQSRHWPTTPPTLPRWPGRRSCWPMRPVPPERTPARSRSTLP